ncbi:MAG: hypothetical protein KDD09_24965, partial [Phaeodactylibacter sp.]|nr:hypothetical protein [Phaeodactylibacter sp.]
MLWFNAPGALLSAQEQTFYLEEWHATEGEQAESLDRLVSITDASSNLYVAGSQLNQYGKYDLLLTKYDNTGYELWSTTFNVTDTTGNVVVGDMALSSGYVIITGTVYNGASNNYDALTLKYNTSGVKQWHKTYNGAGSFYDGGTNIYTDFSNNIYIAGGTASLSNSMNMLCIKYNSSGTQQWAQSIDGYGRYDVAGYVYYRTASTVILVGAVQQSAASWAVGSLTLNTSTGSVATSLVISEVTEVRFYNTSAYPATYFQNDRLSFVTASIDTSASTPDTLHRVDMTFKNGKNDARVFGLGKREAYHNYYLGHIPEGRARVGLYERAVQTDIYNKID